MMSYLIPKIAAMRSRPPPVPVWFRRVRSIGTLVSKPAFPCTVLNIASFPMRFSNVGFSPRCSRVWHTYRIWLFCWGCLWPSPPAISASGGFHWIPKTPLLWFRIWRWARCGLTTPIPVHRRRCFQCSSWWCWECGTTSWKGWPISDY